ncbi:serum response factor-binding protein 1-like isoform X1 [Labrus mixtus]|uniref:serum response factor-binding protein 1-like isoform X1 n=1 Tax=Labrus mixtus TaxID=508554 RepID=UPI0029C08930|nr:serum response factor-binding protein 1-like isoform X1 [Labrus mixtus]
MTKAVVLISVLLLGCTWSLQGVHTQEDDGMDQKVNGADAPVVDAPVVDAPVVDAPAVDAPVVEVNGADAPAVDAPAVDAPAADAPAVDAPVVEVLVVDAPAVDAPAVDAPAVDAPAVEAPAVNATAFNKTEVCVLAPETGSCKMNEEHYFYNSTSMNCEMFIYGGCDGNQNNFENVAECMQRCHTEGEE